MPKNGMYDSDSYTAGAMRRLKSMDTGPNNTPTGALQKHGIRQATGVNTGATPNSTPQGNLQKSTTARGKAMVSYPGMIAQVSGLGGIPRRDPNLGGPPQTQKGSKTY